MKCLTCALYSIQYVYPLPFSRKKTLCSLQVCSDNKMPTSSGRSWLLLFLAPSPPLLPPPPLPPPPHLLHWLRCVCVCVCVCVSECVCMCVYMYMYVHCVCTHREVEQVLLEAGSWSSILVSTHFYVYRVHVSDSLFLSLPPSFPPSLPLPLSLSLPPSLPPSFPPSFPPSLPLSLPLSLSPSLRSKNGVILYM